ncbi:MAG: hypothetical protein JSV67_05570 [Thermoplasmatales archaeon]|nr:MAG: hypothetical protein JSV67_05570 [Thermoplasmatales archaeon]
MSGRLTGFIREFILFFSVLLLILGLIIFFIGITSVWFPDIPKNILNFSEDILNWNIYFLMIGFILLVAGIYYLYLYLKNRKFILDELETNKRSELLKRHSEIKSTVKHMPSKYQKMLKEKEDELKIR